MVCVWFQEKVKPFHLVSYLKNDMEHPKANILYITSRGNVFGGKGRRKEMTDF